MLEKFERYPLTFGPTHIEKLERLSQHLGGKVETLRQARGLQFRSRLRRQQAAQARIHHPRCDRLQRRYAGLDRRRAVQPHPHGRGRRGQDRHEVPPGAGKLGAARGRGLRPRRQHPAQPRHGRRRAAGRRRLRHRHPPELGGGDRGREGQGRQALCDPGRRLRAQIWRARLCRLRRRGAGAGEGARLRLRLHRGLHGHRLDPCRHAGRLCQGRPRAQGDRHRRLLHPGADQSAGARDRPQHRRARRTRQGDRRGRRRADRGLCLSGLRRSVGRDQGSDPALRAPRRHDHRSRLRGKIHAGHDRPRRTRAISRRDRRCSTPISAVRRRSTDTPIRSATDDGERQSAATARPLAPHQRDQIRRRNARASCRRCRGCCEAR